MPRQPAAENAPTPPARSGGLAPIAIMLMTGIAALGGFGTLFSIWARTTAPGIADTLRIASDQYVAGRPAVAARLAATVRISQEDDPQQFRIRAFLIGAGRAGQAAAEADLRQRRRLMAEALPHLEAAAASGFPPGRAAQGHRLFGRSLIEAGRFSEAAAQFKQVVEIDPTALTEILPLLAETQLRATDIPTPAALQTIDTLLATPHLSRAQRAAGHLLRGRVLTDMQQWTAARDELRQATQSTDDPGLLQEADLLQAVSQVAEAQALRAAAVDDGAAPPPAHVTALLDSALATLDRLDDDPASPVVRRARLWSARAYRCAGRDEAALDRAASVRQMRPFAAEAIAGGLEEIELLARQGRAADALQTLRFLIREIGDPKTFDNRSVTRAEFRIRLTEVAERLRRAGQCKTAIDFARALPPIFSTDEAISLEAEAFMEWGRQTQPAARAAAGDSEGAADGALAGDAASEAADAPSALARQRFRSAGQAYAAAAELRFETPRYVASLWMAIDAFQQGHDFHRSLVLLEDYLRFEDRTRRPRGLIAQARALLAIGKPQQSLQPLTDVIEEFPRDALRYEARLIAAIAHCELGRSAEARALLEANLTDGRLAPQSPVWRDSLFVLGELLYRDGYDTHLTLTVHDPTDETPRAVGSAAAFSSNQQTLQNAIRRLEEAVQRYSPLPRARHAAYLAARAHQLAAFWPGVEGAMPGTLDAARRQLNQQRETHLAAALEGFGSLRQRLADDEQEHPLSGRGQAMLRNCYIAEADLLREMHRVAEAADVYKEVSLRYRNEPLALEAMVGQARCLASLGRERESQLLVRQAEKVLQRIPAEWDNRFAETTRYDRAQWEMLLTWLQRDPPAAAPL